MKLKDREEREVELTDRTDGRNKSRARLVKCVRSLCDCSEGRKEGRKLLLNERGIIIIVTEM